MKFFKKTIILFAVLVIAGVAYWYYDVKRSKEKKEKKEKEAQLFAQTDKKIEKIVLKEKGQEPVVIQRREAAKPASPDAEEEKEVEENKGEVKKKKKAGIDEGTKSGEESEEGEYVWAIVSPVQTGGDKFTIDAFVKSLTDTKSLEVVWENLEKQGEYGLSDPEYTFDFYYKGETAPNGIAFGVESLDRKKVFAKVQGREEIVAVSTAQRDSLKKSLFDLRDKRIAPLESGDIVGITLLSPRESYALQKEGESWFFIPDRLKAPSERVDVYTGYLRYGSLSEVVEEKAKNLKQYGFDKPRIIVNFKLKSGSAFMFLVGNPLKKESGDYYYATRSTDAMVFQVTADTANNLIMSKFELKDRHIFDFKADDVKKASFRYDGNDFTVVRDGEEWKFEDSNKVLKKGYSIDNVLYGIASGEYEDVEPVKKGSPAYKETGIDKPKYIVTLHFDGSKQPVKVKLTEKYSDTNKLWMTPDEGETAYLMSGYFVANLPEKKEELLE